MDIPHEDMDIPDDETIVAEGLASFASTFFAMGDPPEVVRRKLIAHWESLGRPPGAFGDAAQAISTLPQPLTETAEKTERLREIREQLGVTSAETYLTASLSAREVLEKLAEDFD